uniref:Uncharacterized protein n=1 Tax=Noccaea caerulescens TaxID=107243 RepID=A0A1J3HLM8_NOCCA
MIHFSYTKSIKKIEFIYLITIYTPKINPPLKKYFFIYKKIQQTLFSYSIEEYDVNFDVSSRVFFSLLSHFHSSSPKNLSCVYIVTLQRLVFDNLFRFVNSSAIA